MDLASNFLSPTKWQQINSCYWVHTKHCSKNFLELLRTHFIFAPTLQTSIISFVWIKGLEHRKAQLPPRKHSYSTLSGDKINSVKFTLAPESTLQYIEVSSSKKYVCMCVCRIEMMYHTYYVCWVTQLNRYITHRIQHKEKYLGRG